MSSPFERVLRAQATAVSETPVRWRLARAWGSWLTGHPYEHRVRTGTFVLAVLVPVGVFVAAQRTDNDWLAAGAFVVECFLVLAAAQGVDPRSTWAVRMDKGLTVVGRVMTVLLVVVAFASGLLAAVAAWLGRWVDGVTTLSLAAVAMLTASMFTEPMYTSRAQRPSFALAVLAERSSGLLLVVVLVPVPLRLAHAREVLSSSAAIALGTALGSALIGLLVVRLRRQRRVVTEAVTASDELSGHVAGRSAPADILLAAARLERALGTALVGWGRSTSTSLADATVRTAVLHYAHRLTRTPAPSTPSRAMAFLDRELDMLPEGTVRAEILELCNRLRADLGPWVDAAA